MTSTTMEINDIELFSSPLLSPSGTEVETFDFKIDEEVPKFLFSVRNIGTEPINISNIIISGLPPESPYYTSDGKDTATLQNLDLIKGTTLLPGDSLPDIFIKGIMKDPGSDEKIYTISINFRATKNSSIKDFSRVWFKIKPFKGSSKLMIILIITLIVGLLLLIIGSLLVYLFVIRPKSLLKKINTDSIPQPSLSSPSSSTFKSNFMSDDMLLMKYLDSIEKGSDDF